VTVNQWFIDNHSRIQIEESRPSQVKDMRELVGLSYQKVKEAIEIDGKVALKVEIDNDYDSDIHEEPDAPYLTINHLMTERRFDPKTTGELKGTSAFEFVWGGGTGKNNKKNRNDQEAEELRDTLTGGSDALIRIIKRENKLISIDNKDVIIENSDVDQLGKLVIAANLETFYEWTPTVKIVESDFLATDHSMILCMPADLKVWKGLAAEMIREYGRKEFLFRQQPAEGKIVSLPPSLTATEGKYVTYLVTRTDERKTVFLDKYVQALTAAKDFLVGRNVTEVSMPIVDPGRGRLGFKSLYSLVSYVFEGSGMMVYLHDRYYLTN
jgi:hypothetical protein